MFRVVLYSFVLNLIFSFLVPSSQRVDDVKEYSEDEHFTNERKGFFVDISKHPYMVSIRVQSYHVNRHGLFDKNCTGAFIHHRYSIITAAHCLVYKRRFVGPNSVSIRYGSPYSDRGGHFLSIDDVRVPVRYFENAKGITTTNDIAFLFLESGKPRKDVEAIESLTVIPKPHIMVPLELHLAGVKNQECQLVGYGITKESKKRNSLESVTMKMLTHVKCEDMLYPLNIRLYAMNVCAYAKGVDTCQGQGGALLICPNLKGPVGVLSFGKDCGKKNRPVVFARVDWFIPQLRGVEERVVSSHGSDLSGEELPDPWLEDWDESKSGKGAAGEDASGKISKGVLLSFAPRLYLFLLIVGSTC